MQFCACCPVYVGYSNVQVYQAVVLDGYGNVVSPSTYYGSTSAFVVLANGTWDVHMEAQDNKMLLFARCGPTELYAPASYTHAD